MSSAQLPLRFLSQLYETRGIISMVMCVHKIGPGFFEGGRDRKGGNVRLCMYYV